MNAEMFRIHERTIKLKVPCQKCNTAGIIIQNCHACNGKGWHNKTFPYWCVAKQTVTIERIDREKYDGPYRFWTGPSEYFQEKSNLVHFSSADAQHECDKRNIDVNNLIKLSCSGNRYAK
jgi:hypothetical protein